MSISAEKEFDADETTLFQLENIPEALDDEKAVQVVRNNCGDRKRRLRRRFDSYFFGSCQHLTPADADAFAAATLLPQLLADGATKNITVGHSTIRNQLVLGPISQGLPNTYMPFACGDK